MKLRKANLKGYNLDLSISFMTDTGRIQDVTGLLGGNLTGKTSLMRFIASAYRDAAVDGHVLPLYFDKMDGEVDFEVNGVITSSIWRQGKFVQKAVLPKFEIGPTPSVMPDKIFDALLFFNSYTRSSFLVHGETRGMPSSVGLAFQTLSDFYNHKIRNSVILVDDLDYGLDRENGQKFFDLLIRKVLEGDNQLVVSSRNAVMFGALDSSNSRLMGKAGDVIGEVVKVVGQV